MGMNESAIVVRKAAGQVISLNLKFITKLNVMVDGGGEGKMCKTITLPPSGCHHSVGQSVCGYCKSERRS